MATTGLIVGLGNPGAQYSETRHNAGYWFVDEIARRYSGSFRSETRFKAQACKIGIGKHSVYLLKPESFMNDSGYPVSSFAAYYKLAAAKTLVAHDELSLECGKVQLKRGGGHAGHNGLRDISKHMGPDFLRVRIGIGRPQQGSDVANYVLNKPRVDEQARLDEAIASFIEGMETLVTENF